jgi:DNA-binding transcriptional regulator YdaS (Cro superfamily)
MSDKNPKDAGLIAALQAAGKVVTLAKKIGISPSAVSMWRRIPPTRVIAVENATGVPRTVLRPDIYPADERSFAQTSV